MNITTDIIPNKRCLESGVFMNQINLKIKYFLKVAECLNFSVAANELFISQPALSKQIKQLEEVIGVSLFIRNTRRVELTPGGKIMYQAWVNVVEITDNAIATAKMVSSQYISKLRIGLVEMGGILDLMIPILNGFSERYKEIELEYSTYGFNELNKKLKNEELDIIFTLSSEIPGVNKGISFLNISKLDLFIMMSKKNPLAQRPSLTVKELENETIYTFSNEYTLEGRKMIEDHCKGVGLYSTKMKNYPNVTSMSLALLSGKGVTIGYKFFFYEVEDKLKCFPISNVLTEHYIGAAWKTSKENNVMLLNDYLKGINSSQR